MYQCAIILQRSCTIVQQPQEKMLSIISHCCFCCSVTKSYPILCDLMDYIAFQAPLSSTISQSLFRHVPIKSVMLTNHLILHNPFLLLPSIFPNIRAFCNELAIQIRWLKYWSFSFSNSPSN